MERMQDALHDLVPEHNPSFFEHFQKNRLFRITALLTTLGITTPIITTEARGQNHGAQSIEMVQSGLDLHQLSDTFSSALRIPGEEKMIIHIGQVHDASIHRIVGGSQEVVQSQKNIEQLVLFLKGTYDIDDFLVEGSLPLDIAWLQAYCDLDHVKEGESPVDVWNRIMQFVRSTENLTEESNRRVAFYAAKVALDRAIETLQKEYEAYATQNGVVDKSYNSLFEGWKREGISLQSMLDSLGGQRTKVADQPEIKGDAVYLMGAAKKLFLEGKVRIRPGETEEGLKEASEKLPRILEGDSDALLDVNEWLKVLRVAFKGSDAAWETINESRDKGVVELASSSDRKIIPVIYGASHQFEDDVQAYNSQNPHSTMGLISVRSSGSIQR